MAYQVKPDATDTLNQSQSDIKNNFQDIKDGFELNHVAFNSGADTGKHKFLTMPVQAAAPSTATTEMALYTKDVSGTPQMFIRRDNDGDEIDVTSRDTTAANASTTLPSGIIIKSGIATSLAGGNTTITFTDAFPNAVLSATVTPVASAGVPQTLSTGISGFGATQLVFWVFDTATGNTLARQAYWIAIGY